LEQSRDSVLRYGEAVGRELLNYVVLPPQVVRTKYLYGRSNYWYDRLVAFLPLAT